MALAGSFNCGGELRLLRIHAVEGLGLVKARTIQCFLLRFKLFSISYQVVPGAVAVCLFLGRRPLATKPRAPTYLFFLLLFSLAVVIQVATVRGFSQFGNLFGELSLAQFVAL